MRHHDVCVVGKGGERAVEGVEKELGDSGVEVVIVVWLVGLKLAALWCWVDLNVGTSGDACCCRCFVRLLLISCAN